MRVLVIISATEESEAGKTPDEETLVKMGALNAELVAAGVMLGGEGLHPSSRGKRLHIAGGRRTLLDGPFAETKELVGGYWIWRVASMDEAVAWAGRFGACVPPGEWVLEIRPILEAEEFGVADT